MKKTTITIILLVIISLGCWWFFSFADKKVSEEPVAEGENSTEENLLITNLFEDVEAESALQSSNDSENVKTFSGIEFTLTPITNPIIAGEETILRFNLMIDGRPANDMQTQDGVYGKSVAVHKESLELVPVEIVRKVTPHGTLEFRTIFPKSGEYRIFTQFKRNDKIITTDFTVLVP